MHHHPPLYFNERDQHSVAAEILSDIGTLTIKRTCCLGCGGCSVLRVNTRTYTSRDVPVTDTGRRPDRTSRTNTESCLSLASCAHQSRSQEGCHACHVCVYVVVEESIVRRRGTRAHCSAMRGGAICSIVEMIGLTLLIPRQQFGLLVGTPLHPCERGACPLMSRRSQAFF